MIEIIFITIIGFLNVARGRKIFGFTESTVVSRAAFAVGAAIVSVCMLGASIWSGPIIAAGLMCWATPGWGKYFSSFTGSYKPEENEIRWIDSIGDLLVIGTDEASNRLRGLLCMCLRGVYLYPMFLGLCLVGYPWAILVGTGCLLQGIPYWLNRLVRPIDTIFPDAVWGGIIALMIMGSL